MTKSGLTLPPHLEPARPFLDALVEMVAASMLRELKTQESPAAATQAESPAAFRGAAARDRVPGKAPCC